MKIFRWEYIGTVEVHSILVGDDGEEIPGGKVVGFWVLREHSWFGRRADYTGSSDATLSPNAREIQKRVHAWRSGGPLPPIERDTQQKKSAPVISLVVNNDKRQ